ncbi:MAG: LacI family transcriptional regulator [Clostridiales bacterium]|jgi:DNA-binding LacI/PurR family transcriptional regulator|nr:LacI family transcriptional regulator [Clostridiales bacterium]
MTLKEIAEQAGVSASTVSRVINSPDNSFARKEVRERVWKIVKDTGYTPNQSARDLKKGSQGTERAKPYTISCILARTRSYEENPFFAQVARAAEQQALSMGCIVAASFSAYDIESPETIRKVESTRTDGALVLGRFSPQACSLFLKHYKHLVYIGRNIIDANLDQVICDGYDAAKTALKHLISNGHSRIGYIGETENEIRFKAYQDIMKERGFLNSCDLVSSCSQDCMGGYAGAKNLLNSAKPLPTAVFCATDAAAIAAIKCFAEHRVKIPNDLSVVGMDDIEIAQFITPMLTTVGMPKVEMGNVAVRTLIDRMNKVHRMPMKIFLPHKLTIRESTAIRKA